MALAKNKNKDTLVGERSRDSATVNDVWVRRGAQRASENQGMGSKQKKRGKQPPWGKAGHN